MVLLTLFISQVEPIATLIIEIVMVFVLILASRPFTLIRNGPALYLGWCFVKLSVKPAYDIVGPTDERMSESTGWRISVENMFNYINTIQYGNRKEESF
jgi:hypothetical protein